MREAASARAGGGALAPRAARPSARGRRSTAASARTRAAAAPAAASAGVRARRTRRALAAALVARFGRRAARAALVLVKRREAKGLGLAGRSAIGHMLFHLAHGTEWFKIPGLLYVFHI